MEVKIIDPLSKGDRDDTTEIYLHRLSVVSTDCQPGNALDFHIHDAKVFAALGCD